MMPWEHVLVGYVGYSLFVHAVYRDSPTGEETLVVVFASLLPDLIDKPLAWEYGVFQSGYALAHSLFLAVPVAVAVGLLALRRGWPRIGWAFGAGYLLHLPADVFPIYLRRGHLPFDRVLWPVRRSEGPSGHGLQEGFVDSVTIYAGELVPPTSPYAVVVAGLGVFGVALWLYDGAPVARESYDALRSSSASLVEALSR